MPAQSEPSILLDADAIIVNDERIDPYATDAAKRLCGVLGPVLKTTPAGLKGVPRTAHWLASGVVVVSEDNLSDALTMIFVCFDREDSSPYPQWVTILDPFRGSVRWGDHVFVAGVDERAVLKIAGIEGYGGMRHIKAGRLFLMFSSKRKKHAPLHQRRRRMLVYVGAQWLSTAPAAAVGEPWAD